MKYWFLSLILILTLGAHAQFEKYFQDKSLRFDYYHTGNDTAEVYSFDEMIVEPYWGGSKTNLIDTMGYGKYYFKVFDEKTNQLIYSRGYCTLFGEWQTSDEARKTWRTISETVVFPFPKAAVRLEFYSRNRDGEFEKKFVYHVNPFDYFIHRDREMVYPSFDVMVNGNPANKVDIVILPEGYTEEQMGKFINDCNKFQNALFSFSPYKENMNKFNVRAVLAPSKESGADIPATMDWKNTILNSGFYTFNSERYLMTYDNKSVRSLAANVPYDQIYILVNTKKYGGGSIYNLYSVCVMNNGFSAKIMVHEFGHGFAGLGDEYYNASTGYNNFYNLKVEPWEPNLTTLVNFDKKWKDMVKKRTPIPTPYTEKYKNKVGVFEGGGYEAKGVYRPMEDCLMRTFDGDQFCPVCTKAIEDMIDFYTE
jgi:IgA Peptidase M64/Peptidase M64 N-terminus